MPYRFKKSEAIPPGIRRIVSEEIDFAVSHLAGSKNRETAIHEARKSVKKIRGVLRLVQPELGRFYRAENRSFRDIGRKLSELRDAQAIIEVFDGSVEKHQGEWKSESFAGIRRSLERGKRETEQALDVSKVVGGAIEGLKAARLGVAEWPLETTGFEALAPGLELTYRSGRGALKSASKNQDPVLLHELRKAVKAHWYHLRLLEGLWTPGLKERASELKDLETWLGDDHNLFVLGEKLAGHPETRADREEVKQFAALSAQEQKQLRAKALALAERLYVEKPHPFVRALAEAWNVWLEKKPGRKAMGRAPARAKAAVA